jgi:hypothetical protein
MTGVQALERAAPTQPMRAGRPERSELEYIRHGTTTLIADFDVATGQVGYRCRPWRAKAKAGSPRKASALACDRSGEGAKGPVAGGGHMQSPEIDYLLANLPLRRESPTGC